MCQNYKLGHWKFGFSWICLNSKVKKWIKKQNLGFPWIWKTEKVEGVKIPNWRKIQNWKKSRIAKIHNNKIESFEKNVEEDRRRVRMCVKTQEC